MTYTTLSLIMVYMSKKKTHQEFMKEVKHKLRYFEVLSEYSGATKRMQFRCKKCGYVFEVLPNSFKEHGCKKCGYKSMKKKNSKSFDEWRNNLPSKYDDYEFFNFTGAKKPITAKCLKCGRVHDYSNAGNFTQGIAGCKSCNCSWKKDNQHWVDLCAKNNLTFLKKNGRNIKVKCNYCQRVSYKTASNLWKSGCKYCSRGSVSKEETEIYEWVKQLCPDAIQSDKSVLSKMGKRGHSLELDIYIPSANVAIEYNGRHYHSTQHLMKSKNISFTEAKNWHRNKSLACEEKGIRLIHIWDYEWQDERKQRVLKNIILGAIKQLPRRVYARECKVCSYKQGCDKWSELNEFFAENNIQGNRGGSIVYTLEKDGEILMAYKFGRPSGGRAKQKYQYEMVRGASANGVQVIGGATKLWKHFIREQDPDSVVYYIDYNYFNGNSVEKIGLECVGGQAGVKNYWVKTREVKNREPSRHAEVKRAIESGECLELWNAGTKTYIYRKTYDI